MRNMNEALQTWIESIFPMFDIFKYLFTDYIYCATSLLFDGLLAAFVNQPAVGSMQIFHACPVSIQLCILF